MRMSWIFGAMMATVLTVGSANAAGHLTGGIKEMSTNAGTVLADTKGMSLYTFDKDSSGTSNCNDKCATAWPPLVAGGNAKNHENLTVITRADGSRQWAYKGAPLYLWQGDKQPGDVTGNGMKNVWHVAKP